jgi:formamidopyrimidine-DNA glycosylase
MEGAVIGTVEQRRPDLRFPFPDGFAAALTGKRILSVGRRAKYLLFHLDADPVLLAHLGMSGSFRIEAEDDGIPGVFHQSRNRAAAHDHVRHVSGARHRSLREQVTGRTDASAEEVRCLKRSRTAW